MNFIHGIIAILVGLGFLIFGPIYFRGFPVDQWTGVVICIFGVVVVGLEFFKRKEKNKKE